MLLILSFCVLRSITQECIAVAPTVVRYNVCDLPYSGDTLVYYSDFDVVKDGPWEHMKVYDYVLPRNLTGILRLTLKGGKGGDSRINCGEELYGNGGYGAKIIGTVRVGDGGIPRGSVIRYVLGEAGQDSYSQATGDQYDRGGSGGGASGLLFKAPDSTTWTVLMIAGGGGGGYSSCFPHDENGVAALYRLRRTGGGGGLEQSSLGYGGAGFYGWQQISSQKLFFVSCDGYTFSADEFYENRLGWPINAEFTDYDAQNFCNKISGGGGYGSRGKAPCGPCSGGQAGNEWTGANLPNVYSANYIGSTCVTYSNMREGGRGFCGGGAAFSRSTWYFGSRHDWQPGCGGGGGARGGAGAIGGANGIANAGTKPAEGGTSWVNEQYVSAYSFAGDNTIENGYGWFKFLPDTSSVLPRLSINIGEAMPLCSGSPVTMVATLAATRGSWVDGIINPVFTWQRNGQAIGNGTNIGYNIFTQVDSPKLYTFNTINLTYNPGDVITCSVSGTDTNLCGRLIYATASFVIPPDNGNAISQVQITANPGDALCQVYYDDVFKKSWGLASFQADARLLANIGNNNSIAYHPKYKWYINGDRFSMRYNVNDSVASIPERYVADGDSVWCEVSSEHCSIPSRSNIIYIHVTGSPSTGGNIAGPQRPCPNTPVTYTVNGAKNAVSYTWVVTGDATNISSGDSNACSFNAGTGNAEITCYTHGTCGDGDTLYFTVTPSNHVTTTCFTPPILVSPATHCAGEPVTLYLMNDTDPDHPDFDCYQWSNGATTRSITVTQDGIYYVYANGCRSEDVVVTGIATIQPSITVGIVPKNEIDNLRNYWCRQDGYRRIHVSSSSDLSSYSSLQYRWYKNGVLVGGTSDFGPDNLDIYLNNNTFYKSHDTITCKLIATTTCGTISTWSNSVILPEIHDPAVPSVTLIPSVTTVCSGVAINFTALPANIGTVNSFGWFVDGSLAGSGSPQFTTAFVNNTGAPQTHTVYCNALGNGNDVLCRLGNPNAMSEIITITVLPQPAVAATAMNLTGCAGSPITLSGSPAGGVFSKPNPYLGPSTTYTYSYIDQNGCSSTSTPATITLTPLPVVSSTVNSSDTSNSIGVSVYPSDTVCAGQSVTLTGFGANSYLWSDEVENGEPFAVNATDTFTLTTWGAGDCNGDRVFVKVATGFVHSLGIKADGTLWAWGSNSQGTLGNGTNTNSNIPVQIGTGTNWVAISAGEYHSLAVKSDGTLWAWGRNVYGTLGNGTNINSNVPVRVGTHTDWKDVAAGGEFSIALKSNGTIWGWGYNNDLEVGTMFGTNPNIPVRIGSDNDWISISSGLTYTLALKMNGTLWAWGTSANGALGMGNISAVAGPVQTGAESNWISVAAGGLHSLAIKADGTLWAWGFNAYGGLGDGTTTNRNTPVQVEPGSHWMSVSGGWYHSAGIKLNGTLWAWGNNSYGQLSNGTYSQVVATPAQMGGEGNWAAISAGGYHTFGIKLYGTSMAWGRNNSGQLGDGSTITERSVPVPVTNPPATIKVPITVKQAPVIAIKVSPSPVVCAGTAISLNATGASSYTWSGGITNGTVFTPSTSDTFTVTGTGANGCTASLTQPVTIHSRKAPGITVSPAASICSGTAVTLKGAGAASYAWNNNVIDGVPFTPTITKTYTLTATDSSACFGDQNFVKVAGGLFHSLGIRSDGTLWAWGYNESGQLGNGTQINTIDPVQVSNGTNWTDIAAGQDYSLGIQSDGTLWSWGRNGAGQLGDGTTTDKYSPVQVGYGTNWLSVSAGLNHAIGIKSDGTLWAWGYGAQGQLGKGTYTSSTTPVRIGTATNWVSVAARENHSLGLKSDGTLWAWGLNTTGQLGDGSTSNRNSPVQVGAGADWKSIATGGSHSLAVKSNGTLWAWGGNTYGQLGDGSTTDKYTPVQVGIGTDWIRVAAGAKHSLGIKSDGTLWAWGSDDQGQLGDDSALVNSPEPVRVRTADTWLSISTGLLYSSGIKSTGSLWTWGLNNLGQLGDGTSMDKPVPVLIGNSVIIDTTITVGTSQNWYLDADGDGYYISGPVSSCISPGNGYNTTATHSGDCDDNNSAVHATVQYYRDADGDGFGNPAISILSCAKPSGYVTNNTDCNDSKATVYPKTWYKDADGDGYGTVSDSTIACTKPVGYVANKTDCSDNNTAIRPGAPEICDGIDNNCNGTIDEGFTKTIYYRDADGDGYGNAAISAKSCSPLAGYVTNKKDCNDGNTSIRPGAVDICDNMDNDCDGLIDEDCRAITIADISVTEGNANQKAMNFAVTLNKVSVQQTITVNYTTENVTATAGSDYIAGSGTVSFLPGIKKVTVQIAIKGDKTIEPNETFKVVLSNPVNATIADGEATGTIVNDDGIAIAGQSIAISTNDGLITSAKLAPNPASNKVNVLLNGYSGAVTINIMSLEGKLLLQKKVNASLLKYMQEPIDVSHLASGVYMVIIFDEAGRRRTEKLVVAH